MKAVSDAVNRLRKWRTVFAGWQLGASCVAADATGAKGLRAVRDAADARLVQRAELTALVELLMRKGVFTLSEFAGAVSVEADRYATDLELMFPGFRATGVGIDADVPVAAETMRRLGFPD